MLLLVSCLGIAGCTGEPRFATGGDAAAQTPLPVPGDAAEPDTALPPRTAQGDEIVIAGQRFHIGAPVVLWTDPGGYTASAGSSVSPPFDTRFARGGLEARELEAIHREGWTLPALQRRVDQLVLHYDTCGVSALCADVLEGRGLSVHFMLDIDGTIYQTMDVQHRAWHATKANDRSVGIEIANIGAYGEGDADPLALWYARDEQGTFIRLPPGVQRRYGARGGVHDSSIWPLRPARDGLITGRIHGNVVRQYDLTAAQYDSLIKLAAALHRSLPEIRLEYPRGPDGRVLARAMSEAEFAHFTGVLGHWHVQSNKIDPGPALDFDRVVNGARGLAR